MYPLVDSSIVVVGYEGCFVCTGSAWDISSGGTHKALTSDSSGYQTFNHYPTACNNDWNILLIFNLP